MILEQLYKGNIQPCNMPAHTNPVRDQYRKKSMELQRELEKRLDLDGRAMLETMQDIDSQQTAFEVQYKFVDGFRLGSLMMLEILHDADNLLFSNYDYHNNKLKEINTDDISDLVDKEIEFIKKHMTE